MDVIWRPTRVRYTVRPGHWTATTTFAAGCLPATLSHTAFKSQEKPSDTVPARVLRRRAIGSPRLYFLQMLTTFLQFIGEHYFATGQDQITFFEANDRKSTRDWKAVSEPESTRSFRSELPVISPLQNSNLKFSSGNLLVNHGVNPLTD